MESKQGKKRDYLLSWNLQVYVYRHVSKEIPYMDVYINDSGSRTHRS